MSIWKCLLIGNFSLTVNKKQGKAYKSTYLFSSNKSNLTNDNEWVVHRVKTSGTKSDNEWQGITTSDNKWQRVVHWVKTNGTKSDNEWQRVTTSEKEWQRMTTSNKERQRMVKRVTTNDSGWPFRLIFLFFFFQIREEPTTKHPKENFLTLEEELWFFK